jgi:hypothetical protein
LFAHMQTAATATASALANGKMQID